MGDEAVGLWVKKLKENPRAMAITSFDFWFEPEKVGRGIKFSLVEELISKQ
jgi:hypothetical protein